MYKKGTFVLFVNTSCPYCHWATDLLENNSLTYKKIILPSNGTVSNEVKIAFDQKTVPIIFFKREDEKSFELIGGFTDLEKIIYG